MNVESLVFNMLSLVGLSLQAYILVRMYRTNLRRELRMFFAYTFFCVCRTLLLFSLRNYFGRSSVPYFLAYYATMLGDIALAFFIIQEVYAKVLYRYEGLKRLSALIFRWAFLVLIGVAIITAISAPAADHDPTMAALTVLDRSAMLVELGLILLLFVFANFLALSWRECIFGIAVGMCLFCSFDLAALSIRSHFGESVASAYAFAKPIAYVATVVIWSVYLARAENARMVSGPLASPKLDEWNATVMQFLHR